jgi:hypothetical protein
MIRVVIDGADVQALRARIARWMPEVSEATDEQIETAVEDAIADAGVRSLYRLRMGVAEEEASFRSSLRRQMVVSASLIP